MEKKSSDQGFLPEGMTREELERMMDFIGSEKNHVDEVRGKYDDCVWAKRPDPIPEDQIAETLETEVVIVPTSTPSRIKYMVFATAPTGVNGKEIGPE